MSAAAWSVQEVGGDAARLEQHPDLAETAGAGRPDAADRAPQPAGHVDVVRPRLCGERPEQIPLVGGQPAEHLVQNAPEAPFGPRAVRVRAVVGHVAEGHGIGAYLFARPAVLTDALPGRAPRQPAAPLSRPP